MGGAASHPRESLEPLRGSTAPLRDSLDPVEQQARLALRIVLELRPLPRPGDDQPALPTSTQLGLAAALATSQGAISKVLQRLLAAQVVAPRQQHVNGFGRRVRVYYLTPRGEGLAREYRRRLGPGN